MPDTTKSLIEGIRKQLGQDRGHGVAVETSDGQIAHAIRLALSEYSRYFPIRSFQSFVAPPGMYVYTPKPAIRGVIEIDMLEEIEGQVASPEVALLGGRLSTLGASFQFSSPRGWAIYKQWKTVAERVFSSKPDWRFIPEDGNLYIYNPIQNTKITVVGVIDFDVAFDEEAPWEDSIEPDDEQASPLQCARLDDTLRSVPQRHMRWVRSLTKAKTKEILGYMRRKYSSIPSADRADTQMDGAQMVSEGVSEWKDTINEMLMSVPALVPTLG